MTANGDGGAKTDDFHRISVDGVGDFNVFVEGDLKVSSRVLLLTVHDLGCSHSTFLKPFLDSQEMKGIKSRCTVIHVDLPGQGDNAQALNANSYPGMSALGNSLKSVLQQLGVSRPVVGLAEGAGANVLLRFLLQHPNDVLALCLCQCTVGQASLKESFKGRSFSQTVSKKGLDEKSLDFLVKRQFGKKRKETGHESLVEHFVLKVINNRNGHNLSLFTEAFRNRRLISGTELDSIKKPLLLITGKESYFHDAVVAMKESFTDRTLVNLLEMSDVASPLEENPQATADGIQYFLQGNGLLAAVPMRKKSGLTRGMSMETADKPSGIHRKESMDLSLQLKDAKLEPDRQPDNVVEVKGVGNFNVFVDTATKHANATVLTVHDLGTDHKSMEDLVNSAAMASLRERITFIHVDLPGQGDNEKDLQLSGPYPQFTVLGGAMKDILDSMKVKKVVGLGEGAGANVLARFALQHPDACLGLCLINASCSSATFMENLQGKIIAENFEQTKNALVSHRFGSGGKSSPLVSQYVQKIYASRNEKNLKAFMEAFKNRNELTKQELQSLKANLLLVSAKDSKFNKDMHDIKSKMFENKDVSILEISDILNPLVDGQEKLGEGFQYFLQGLGLCPAATPRRKSSVMRGVSMESADEKKPLTRIIAQEEEKKAPMPKYVVDVEGVGAFRVFVEPATESQEMAFLTVHDLGTDHESMSRFALTKPMEGLRKRAAFYHVDLPGQEDWAPDLPAGAKFPGMTALGNALKKVVDTLALKNVVGFGEGAGANVVARFALQHPGTCRGLCLINCTAAPAGFLENLKDRSLSWKLDHLGNVDPTVEEFLILHRFGTSVFKEAKSTKEMEDLVNEFKTSLFEKRNINNLKKFVEAFKTRRAITAEDVSSLQSPALLITAKNSRFNKDSKDLHAKLETEKKSTLLEVNATKSPIHEGSEAVADGIQYFLQGMGMIPAVPMRKRSGLARGMSMEKADEKRNLSHLTPMTSDFS